MDMRLVRGRRIVLISTIGVGLEEDVVQEGETITVADWL